MIIRVRTSFTTMAWLVGGGAVGGRGGHDRGRVVDRRPREQAERLLAHPDRVPDEREDEDGRDVEQEDRRDRVGDVGRRGLDHRRDRGDRRPAADAGADADQRAQVARDAEQPPVQPRRAQADGERAQHDRQRRHADAGRLGDRELGAEQDHRALQEERAAELHAGREPRAGLDHQSDDRADDRAGNGAADQRHVLPDDRRHRGDGDRQGETGGDTARPPPDGERDRRRRGRHGRPGWAKRARAALRGVGNGACGGG